MMHPVYILYKCTHSNHEDRRGFHGAGTSLAALERNSRSRPRFAMKSSLHPPGHFRCVLREASSGRLRQRSNAFPLPPFLSHSAS